MWDGVTPFAHTCHRFASTSFNSWFTSVLLNLSITFNGFMSFPFLVFKRLLQKTHISNHLRRAELRALLKAAVVESTPKGGSGFLRARTTSQARWSQSNMTQLFWLKIWIKIDIHMFQQKNSVWWCLMSSFRSQVGWSYFEKLYPKMFIDDLALPPWRGHATDLDRIHGCFRGQTWGEMSTQELLRVLSHISFGPLSLYIHTYLFCVWDIW